MNLLAQQLVNGLFIGSVYGLFAVGYTLVFGVLDILNLAHAAVFTLGGLSAVWLVQAGGMSIWTAFPLAVLLAGLLGLLLDRVAFVPLRKRADSQFLRAHLQHRHGDHLRERRARRCSGRARCGSRGDGRRADLATWPG